MSLIYRVTHKEWLPWEQISSMSMFFEFSRTFSVENQNKQTKYTFYCLPSWQMFICFYGRLLSNEIGYPKWDLASRPGLAQMVSPPTRPRSYSLKSGVTNKVPTSFASVILTPHNSCSLIPLMWDSKKFGITLSDNGPYDNYTTLRTSLHSRGY